MVQLTAQDLYKTKICEYYQRGRCPREKCTFAHGEAELRRLPPQGGRGYDHRRGPLAAYPDRRMPRQYSPRPRSRSPPDYRGEANGRREPRPIAERLGDKRPVRRSETPSSHERSPKRARVEASLEDPRRSSSDAGQGRERNSNQNEDEGENEREASISPRRSLSPSNDAQYAELEKRLEEERAANEELEAKLATYDDLRSELADLHAENVRLTKTNLAQKEKLEIMQDLVERKNRDNVEAEIKLAKLQKRSKSAEDSAWAVMQLKKLAKADQQKRQSKQQYSQLLGEALDVLRDHPAHNDETLDMLPTPKPEALRIEARQRPDYGPTANGNLDERPRRAAVENGPGGSPNVNKEPPHRSPVRERGQEEEGEAPLVRGGSGRLDRRLVGLRQYGGLGRADNWEHAKGDEEGAGNKGETGGAKYPFEPERLARKAPPAATQTAAQSEVGGGVFKLPANVVRNVRRFEEGNGVGANVRGRAVGNERAPLGERANAGASPAGAGEYTETAKEEFQNMAYPMPLGKDTVLEARYEETSEAVNIG